MSSLVFNIFLCSCLLICCGVIVPAQYVDPWDVRCHVCKIVVHEMEEAVEKVDPKKKAEVGGFRLDIDGNAVSKAIQYKKSEIFLTELMETICEKLEDYAKVTYKKDGRLGVLKFAVDGALHPDISEVNFVEDGDLNKSLKHYCLEILEDHEESFLEAFMSEKVPADLDISICSTKAKYCKDAPVQEDYKLEEDTEYKDEL